MDHFSILVMAREPAPGRVKTRLSPPLSHQLASYLYEAMLSDTIDIVISLKGAGMYLFVEPQNSPYFDRYGGMGISILPQSGINLGEKMENAAKLVWEQSKNPLIIIGTDIPLLTPSIITRSVAMLESTDIVIGPCDDGGYYLIGMRDFTSVPFQQIPWSTDRVLKSTIAKLEEGALSFSFTEELFDIDTARDIEKYVQHIAKKPNTPLLRTRFSRAAIKLSPHLGSLLSPGA